MSKLIYGEANFPSRNELKMRDDEKNAVVTAAAARE
jgi:hypothetical protein